MLSRRHALACLALFGGSVRAQPSAAPRTLLVSAAASLADAFAAAARRFEQGFPGVTVRLNIAGSNLLLQQLAQGAPADLLATADEATLDRALAQGLLDPATRRVFAGNALVLVVPAQAARGAPPPAAALADLRDAQRVRRLAIGKPASTPVGRYTQQALQAAGLWDTLQPRLVPADHVRQALDYVARGEVDAGVVYRSDAIARGAGVRAVATLAGHEPIRYPLAVASASRQGELAHAFAGFIVSDQGQAILAQHGLLPPPR